MTATKVEMEVVEQRLWLFSTLNARTLESMRLLTTQPPSQHILFDVKWTFPYPIILPKIIPHPEINCQGTSRLEPVAQANLKSKVSKFPTMMLYDSLWNKKHTFSRKLLGDQPFWDQFWGATFNPKSRSNHYVAKFQWTKNQQQKPKNHVTSHL